MTSQQPRTVLLVDDHDLIRQGLARAFDRSEGFQVVGHAATLDEARHLAAQLSPQVVTVDVRLPDGNGLDLVRALWAEHPDIRVVVLSMYAGDDQMFAAMEAGASAFISKEVTADEVVAAARHAALSPRSFTAADLAGAMRRKISGSEPHLSPRETEVLRLLADGLGVAAIAKHLFVSESTAKTHIAKIYEKLGAANRAQAIMKAVRSGLLSDS